MIAENSMTIPSWQCCDLGHLVLTMDPTDFKEANDDTDFIIPSKPTDPSKVPSRTNKANHFIVLKKQRACNQQKDKLYKYKLIEKNSVASP